MTSRLGEVYGPAPCQREKVCAEEPKTDGAIERPRPAVRDGEDVDPVVEKRKEESTSHRRTEPRAVSEGRDGAPLRREVTASLS